mgnify:CR=1 FL=1
MEKKKEKHRIPYDNWRNSQLSVARFYGGCKLNGKEYILDFDNCKKEIINGKEKYFPDLVEV